MENMKIFEENVELAILGKEDFYSSFKPQNEDDEMTMYNALMNPEKRLKDFVNQDILVKDVIIERVYVNKEGEEYKECAPRVILIDTKGISYACVSFGILNALKRMMDICGKPTWASGKKLRVIQQASKRNNGSMLGLKLVK